MITLHRFEYVTSREAFDEYKAIYEDQPEFYETFQKTLFLLLSG